MGFLRGFLLTLSTATVASLVLLLSTARSVLNAMAILFMRNQVTRMAGVQLWVVLTTLLLVVRFLLDFFGPWNENRSMMATVNTIESLNYALVHYTIGLMQLSAARPNDYFQVWAVLLVTLQYSVKIGRPYHRSKQIPLLDLMSSFWTANLLRMQTVLHLKIPLWLAWALNAARIISYFSFTEKAEGINQQSNRFVADYMSYEHEPLEGTQSPASAAEDDKEFTMEGYKYLILGEDQALKNIQEGRLTDAEQSEEKLLKRRRRVLRLDRNRKELITVEKIWQYNSGLLGDKADRDGQLKELCLSFALYKLLRRRFYNLPVHEARLRVPLEKIRRLVFKYILKDDEKRAFRIVSMELSFLQDLFYSKHAAMFANGFPIVNLVLSLLLLTAVGYIAFPVRHIPERVDPADRNRITHGVFITRFIIVLIGLKELAEIYMYVFSQWTKVLMLCSYVKHEWMRHWLVEMVMRVVLCLKNRRKWDQKIRQYNLLISTRGFKIGECVCSVQSKFPIGVKLEEFTKKAIFKSLRKLGDKLLEMEMEEQDKKKMVLEEEQKKKSEMKKKNKNKKTELEEQEIKLKMERVKLYISSECFLLPQFNWTLDFEADTHKIIVWHIATCLCEIAHDSKTAKTMGPSRLPPGPFIKKPEPEQHNGKDHDSGKWWEHYITAASLSNYCMYLVVEASVPDNGIVAKNVFREVYREINYITLSGSIKSLFSPRSIQDVHDRMMAPKRSFKRDGNSSKDISNYLTRQGTRLAKELMAKFRKDEARLWEQLAHFWIGFLLYLAACTKASKHRLRLAGRRELITHLWALLSHAGCMGSVAHGHTSLDAEELETLDPTS